MSIKITNFKLGIGWPCSWQHVPLPFFESVIQMERPNFIYLPAHNGPISGLRNHIVEQGLNAGCSHILMMDTDQIYPSDTITKLLSHKLPVVHGKIFRRYPPFDEIMLKGEVNKFISMEEGKDYKDGKLVCVDAVGTGTVLYSTEVFYKIPQPWYEFIENPDQEIGGVIGEDISFCLKLKKAGFKIFVDTSIKIGHITPFVIDENFSRLYKSLTRRQKELDDIRNNSLGGVKIWL